MREPEPEVVRRAAGGNLAAFEELVRASQADLYRFVLHLVADREAAADVTQEAFLRAFRSLRRFRGDAKFTTWLYRIARNCAVDHIRRAARQRRLAERAPGEAVAEDPSLRLALSAAVAGLPPDLREPFVLIEIMGLTYREAAKVLGTFPGTLKSRMHRARHLLIRALGEEQAGEM